MLREAPNFLFNPSKPRGTEFLPSFLSSGQNFSRAEFPPDFWKKFSSEFFKWSMGEIIPSAFCGGSGLIWAHIQLYFFDAKSGEGRTPSPRNNVVYGAHTCVGQRALGVTSFWGHLVGWSADQPIGRLG